FFFYSTHVHPLLHSFPTRRSSDLLRPTRRDSFYWFNNRLLLEAKVALYLKESLGTSTEVLALFARALSGLKDEEVAKLRYVSLRSEEHTSELQSRFDLVCRLLLEK